jgi:hypothetical protein
MSNLHLKSVNTKAFRELTLEGKDFFFTTYETGYTQQAKYTSRASAAPTATGQWGDRPEERLRYDTSFSVPLVISRWQCQGQAPL